MGKTIAIYTITSSLHREVAEDLLQEQFIRDIAASLGDNNLVLRGSDYSDFGTFDRSLVYVRTGGTEGIFKGLHLPGYIRLLTSGKSNSLAASMEILAYLRLHGQEGEIIHGNTDYMVSRILAPDPAASEHRYGAGEGFAQGSLSPKSIGSRSEALHLLPNTDFGGARLGVIGKPSDWLIASDVDYAKAQAKLGLALEDIPIDELIDEVNTINPKDIRGLEGSEAIYEALKHIVERYGLSGLTIRCFDLLDTLHNTGCLALARLNADGIPSSCEGDIPALITMMLARKLTGVAGFQCNLSKVDGRELLFAHCTVPLNMVESYRYDTHFESGMGTAIKGELPLGAVTVLKVSPELDSYVAIHGELVRNQSEPGLCRTQVIVRVPEEAIGYFLTASLANHHVIVPGHIL